MTQNKSSIAGKVIIGAALVVGTIFGINKLTKTGKTLPQATGTPFISNIIPSSGYTVGGLPPVVVTGQHFLETTKIMFSTSQATDYTINSDNQITVTPPEHQNVAQVNILITNAMGTSLPNVNTRYNYIESPPQLKAPAIAKVVPGSGLVAGGFPVKLIGTHFNGTNQVRFGDKLATNYKVLSPDSMTITDPSSPAGMVDITASNSYGTSLINSADQFTYLPVPAPNTPAGNLRGYFFFSYSGPAGAATNAQMAVSYVAGNAFGQRWSDLEPSKNHFVWKSYDTAYMRAYHAHKKFVSAINGGNATPLWVLQECKYLIARESPTQGAPISDIYVPLPWDANLRAELYTLIDSLAKHLKKMPDYANTYAGMKVFGTANINTYETKIPSTNKVVVNGVKGWYADSEYLSVKYRPSKVINNIEYIIDRIDSDFPGKVIFIAAITGGGAFPNIDESGHIYTQTGDSDNVTPSVLRYAAEKYNALAIGTTQHLVNTSGTTGMVARAQTYQHMVIGWQVCETCYDPNYNKTPLKDCDIACMEQALGIGKLVSGYIEIFPKMTDPGFYGTAFLSVPLQ